MVDEVQREIERIRGYISDGRLASCDETNTKATAIEPILRELGWDIADLDEVRREFPVRGKSIDFLLFCDNTPKIIVEAKRGNQSLQRHQEQLQDYVGFALAERIEIAILTNGAVWWYYLPLGDASWERRRVATVEFNQQDSKEIAQTLVDLLGKENVRSGKAIQNAESRQIVETLPRIWNQLITEADNSIVDLLVEQVQGLCVREPGRSEVEQFLSKHRQQVTITSPPATPEPAPSPESATVSEPAPRSNISGTSERTTCEAFTFRGNRYEVSSWRNLLVKLCEIIHTAHRNRFEEVLSLRGEGGATYFSRDSNDFTTPKLINETRIFVEVNLSAGEIRKRARDLITHFKYGESDLSYETRTL